jgi:luciferase-like monooxygenase
MPDSPFKPRLPRPTDCLPQQLRKALLAIPGVVEAANVFGEDDAFWLNGTQIAHWREPWTLELRLTKRLISERRAELKQDPRVILRRGSSDWLMLHFDSRDDVIFAARLAIAAANAHRPPPGTPLRPPPAGADLARRRRFH